MGDGARYSDRVLVMAMKSLVDKGKVCSGKKGMYLCLHDILSEAEKIVRGVDRLFCAQWTNEEVDFVKKQLMRLLWFPLFGLLDDKVVLNRERINGLYSELEVG